MHDGILVKGLLQFGGSICKTRFPQIWRGCSAVRIVVLLKYYNELISAYGKSISMPNQKHSGDYLWRDIVWSPTSSSEKPNSLQGQKQSKKSCHPTEHLQNKYAHWIERNITCAGKALRPKSEIFRFPCESRRRFSGCT